jgi:hypothetical protein
MGCAVRAVAAASLCRTDTNVSSCWKADSGDSDFTEGRCQVTSHGVGGMLITGPHGCGKSAAVQACAQVCLQTLLQPVPPSTASTLGALQELHMNILEISPAVDRSGSNLLRLSGEATQSHNVRAMPASAAPPGTLLLLCLPSADRFVLPSAIMRTMQTPSIAQKWPVIHISSS